MTTNNPNLQNELFDLVLQYYEGNKDKALLWFRSPNPMFGGFSPDQMSEAGQNRKVLEVVNNQLEGTEP